MWNRVPSEEASGKKVLGFFYNIGEDKLLITFDDETFVYCEARMTYEDVDLVEHTFDPLNFGEERILASGVIAEKELVKLRAKADFKYKKQLEARERWEFERLKVKFEGV
jgi:hypothetical protein